MSKEVKLTVAIPTMRRWEFLQKTIPDYLAHPFIQYVVVCDETGEDIDAIQKTDWCSNPKLKLYKNPKRLGIYYNKRKCIELAPTEWVAVLDSDNFFDKNFFNALESIWKNEGARVNHFYAAGNGLFVDEKQNIHNPLQGFGGTKLDISAWNAFFNKPKWNYMLNDGNWIVHCSVLNALPNDVQDKDILATDAIYMARQFVKHGYIYDIREELSYIHSVHKGSSWILQGNENNRIFKETNWKIE